VFEGVKVPLPALPQLPLPDTELTVPVRATRVEVAQIDLDAPAIVTGCLVMATEIVACCIGHMPLLVELRVNFTFPALMSPALIEYVVFTRFADGTKVPVPFADQLPLDVALIIFPLRAIVFWAEHICGIEVAVTIANELTNTVTELATVGHGVFPVELSVNTTRPFVMSVGWIA
jgi:hypothetical protein